jgi:hypothetical protein
MIEIKAVEIRERAKGEYDLRQKPTVVLLIREM